MSLDLEIWRMLFLYQSHRLKPLASKHFWRGVEELNLSADKLPKIELLQKKIHTKTGWLIFLSPEPYSRAEFYASLALRQFPIISKLRPSNEVFWAQEPDFWHDVFGHLPLLVNEEIATLYETFGKAYVEADRDADLQTKIDRLYWHTAEFGFLLEDKVPKIFGAGILPSPDALKVIAAGDYQMSPFAAPSAAHRAYAGDEVQKNFFAADSLSGIIADLSDWLKGDQTHVGL